ncbi:hypothetical protein AS188_01340 [Kocuria flava]|uniref:DUF3151 domain-containing protein n=1 Tax=Kocuria flava TaxID=446860 RepID=A0A0U3HLZ8_9MICC|nr:DUF3151 domain-containing protein [Kocuria flava]ALU38614.1 hypothetical protein AS188_01340 [Kocuria flava]GEO91654.1 hypothetical protein KFL01_09600 [Kocuria flava]
MSLAGKNLLDGPEPTLLSEDPALSARLEAGDEAEDLALRFPKASLPWAMCAEDALDEGRTLEGYAYARVGYHRGLDALRRHGWKGHGPVPFAHEPNRGFLRALAALGRAAAAIGELDEAERIQQFLDDSDPTAAAQLSR